MIKYNVPAVTGKERGYISEVFASGRFSGSHEFNRRCVDALKLMYGSPGAHVTPSCTHALEMSALLPDIGPGDEVIMSSYGFTSTANAFVLRGARIVFVDIRPDTMNLDERLVEEAVTDRTRAVVAMHYAGVSCDMDVLTEVTRRRGLLLVEDAAQAMMSSYRGRQCGTFGLFGCLSFHETKNIQCGEGGALIVNDPAYVARAEIIQEKGTDRTRFFRGEVDKYTWVDIGSSYLLGELGAAFLLAQLEAADEITTDRMRAWSLYKELLGPLESSGAVSLPVVPDGCSHNGHIFYIKVKDMSERTSMIKHLRDKGVHSLFHYVPLHSSPAGLRFGRMHGADKWTTRESERILRLPLYYGIREEDVAASARGVYGFFGAPCGF